MTLPSRSSRLAAVASSAVLVLLLLLGAPGPARAQSCFACDEIFASDCNFGLWLIDPPAGTSLYLGMTTEVLFDIGFTPTGRLFGLDSSFQLWEVDSCDASSALVGRAGGNGLGGDRSEDLFAQGPPLLRIDGTTFNATPIGGALGSGPPDWCGLSSGDLALEPASGLFYSTLNCPTCGGDMLVVLSPATGEVVREVGCIVDRAGKGLKDIHGLAFTSSGALYGGQAVPRAPVWRIDPGSGVADPIPLPAGFGCVFGLASVPCGLCAPDPIPPPQGNVLQGLKALPDVRLEFPGAPATSWRVYRDTDKRSLGMTALTPDVTSAGFTDPGAVLLLPRLGLYQLRGLSPCTSTPGP